MSTPVPPRVLQAEAGALGAALWSREAARRLTGRIPDAAYSTDQGIWLSRAYRDLLAREITPDLVVVYEELKRAGRQVLALDLEQLANDVPQSVRTDPTLIDPYIDLILKAYRSRRIIAEGKRLVERAQRNGDDPGALLADFFEQVQDIEAPAGPGPVLLRLSDVQATPVDWLWPGRIPIGKLSLVVGDPGLGKSFLTIDLAARISTGRAWPDDEAAPMSSTILLSAEDGTADTVRPRFDIQRGDPDRVHILTGVGDPDKPGSFNIARDVEHLENAILQTGARLVVIDPLGAYLGDTDSHRDADVRGVLAPVVAMADRCRVAVLGIVHLNKSQQRQALYRAQGSLAFVAAARAVFGVAEDQGNPGRRLFVPLKMNLAPRPPALAFRLDGGRLTWDEGTVEVDADLALGGEEARTERTERDEAVEFLREILRGDAVPATEVRHQAAAAGIADRTLKRAKAELHVSVRKQSFGGGWTWELPKGTTLGPLTLCGPLRPSSGDLAPFEGGHGIEEGHEEGHTLEKVAPLEDTPQQQQLTSSSNTKNTKGANESKEEPW